MKYGAAIRLSSSQGITPKDIINLHFSKAKESGSVLFSSDIPFSKSRKINELLLVFNHVNKFSEMKEMYVLADVIETDFSSESFIHSETEIFSPEIFAEEPKRSWFKIKNIRVETNSLVESCAVHYDNGTNKSLIDVIHQPRFNRCYYVRDLETNTLKEDELLIY